MDRDTHHRFYWSIDGGNEERSSDGRKDVVQNSRLNSEPLAEAGARTDLEMCFQIFFTVRDGTGSDGKQSRFSAMPSSMLSYGFKGMVGPEMRWWSFDHVIGLDEGKRCAKWESRRDYSSCDFAKQ